MNETESENDERADRWVTDLCLRLPAGEVAPLSILGERAGRGVATLLAHAVSLSARRGEGGDESDGRREFATAARRVLGQLEREGDKPHEVLTAWRCLARSLFAGLSPTGGPPEQTIARAFLEEIDWRFSSRYAAAKELKRRGGPSLSESDLSKLSQGKGGVSLARLSEIVAFLGLDLHVSGFGQVSRLCAHPSQLRVQSSHRDGFEAEGAESPGAWVVRWWRTRSLGALPASAEAVAGVPWSSQPYVLMTRGSSEKIERIVPVEPWGVPDEGLSRYLGRISRDILRLARGAARARSSNVPDVAAVEPRSVLANPPSVIPNGAAVVLSAFDLGSPLVSKATPEVWIDPGDSGGASLRRIPDEALLGDIDELHAEVFDGAWTRRAGGTKLARVGLLAAHAAVSAILDRSERLPGPVPREVAWRGPAAVLLLNHLETAEERLPVPEVHRAPRLDPPDEAVGRVSRRPEQPAQNVLDAATNSSQARLLR